MNKQRKTSNILNVFQYNETTGAVTLPSTLDLTAPGSSDDSTKAPTTAWVRTLISSLGYVTLSTDQTITGLKTIVRSGDVLNFKIGTDNLYALKIVYNQNELVESGEATWSFANTFNNGSGTGITTTPISFFRGVLVTGQRLLSASVNANLLDYYGNNPSGRYPVYAYNTGVQQFATGVIVGDTAGVVNAATGAIADLPAGVVANFKGRVIGSNAVNNNEFVTLSQLTNTSGAYLPLSGGTLTGPLNGTSASFTGGFELNTTGTGALGFFGANNTTDKYIRIRNSSGNFEMGTSSSEHYLLGNGGIPLKFYTNGSPSLTLASTGAATFNSTIQTTGLGIGGANNGTQLIYGTMSTTNTVLELNNTNASGYGGYIRAALGGTQYILRLVDQAGNNRFSFYGDGTSNFSGAATFSSSVTSGTHNINNLGVINLNSQNGFQLGADSFSGGFYIYDNTTGIYRFKIANSGAATFSNSITTSGNINVNSDGIFINRSTSGEPYVFFQKNGVNRGAIYGVTGGGLRIFDESDNQVLTITGTRLGISDPSPSRKLTVNFGTSVNDGLIVYGYQRQNTVFRSTGEHCFVYIDSHHANTFLPVLTFQRSSVSYGSIGLNRASNSDDIGAFAESEMVVGSVTTVPFSLQTNGVRRIRINGSGGQVEIFNTLSVSGNMSARNFIKQIKTWYPAGATGSGTSVTYNWADELAALAGNFDSAGFYKGFLRSANGAHYHGYHFDILVGNQGYGSNSLQYKVQNIVSANAPWAGGCGFSPFGTVDTTNFVHNNNPCGEALELFITRLG